MEHTSEEEDDIFSSQQNPLQLYSRANGWLKRNRRHLQFIFYIFGEEVQAYFEIIRRAYMDGNILKLVIDFILKADNANDLSWASRRMILISRASDVMKDGYSFQF